MAHKHSVYDTDNHFQIDGVTRAVRNASQTKTMLVQGDHNSERFTFEIPRYVDAHDMSVCNVVQVHYTNTDSKDSTKFNKGTYEVDDLQVSPDDEDVVICSWLISGNATKYVGKLEFGIRFSCVSDDGTLDYVWNTAKHTNVYVTEGIYNGDVIAEEYVDILAQHEARIKALEQGGGTGGGDTGGSDEPGSEPVAFLYNGVRFPGINSVYTPELQKTHPYAEIHYVIPDNDYSGIGYYMVSFYTAPYYVNAEDRKMYFHAECDCIYHSAWNTDGSVRNGFEEPGYENNWPTHLSWGTFSENWIWTNFDVCDNTGKVLLAGSEPVPVYE